MNWCALIDKKKIRTMLNLLLNIIWDGRRDHLVGYITFSAVMPSSLVGEARGSLEWFSITKPAGNVMLQKIEDKNHNNMSAQRTSRGFKKYGSF